MRISGRPSTKRWTCVAGLLGDRAPNRRSAPCQYPWRSPACHASAPRAPDHCSHRSLRNARYRYPATGAIAVMLGADYLGGRANDDLPSRGASRRGPAGERPHSAATSHLCRQRRWSRVPPDNPAVPTAHTNYSSNGSLHAEPVTSVKNP